MKWWILGFCCILFFPFYMFILSKCVTMGKCMAMEYFNTKEGISGKKDRCPYGHKFGKDTDEFPECSGCGKWDDCFERWHSCL